MNVTFSFNYGVPKSPPNFHVILKRFGYPYFELLMTVFNFRAWWLNISLQTMNMVSPLTSCFIWFKINNFAWICTWISHSSNFDQECHLAHASNVHESQIECVCSWNYNMCLVESFPSAKRSLTLDAHILGNS